MTKIEEYIQLLDTTAKHSITTSPVVHRVSNMLKDILTIAKQMQYTKAANAAYAIIEQYGKIQVGSLGENKKIKYLVVNPPPAVCEKIQNLVYHVKDKQVCDIAENIVILR